MGQATSANIDDYSNRVVCAVKVDNKSSEYLRVATHFIHNGQVDYGPYSVSIKSHDTSLVGHQTLANCSGTTGVVGWEIGDTEDMLVLLWCAPYNFDHYNNCYALGFRNRKYVVNFDTYHDMYYDSFDDESWFVRKEVCYGQYDPRPIVKRKGRWQVEATMGDKHKCEVNVTFIDVPSEAEKAGKPNSNNCRYPKCKQEDLPKIQHKLWNVSAQWEMIALNLGILYGNIETIKKDNPNDSKNCLLAVLSAWINNGDATCHNLSEALYKCDLAELGDKCCIHRS